MPSAGKALELDSSAPLSTSVAPINTVVFTFGPLRVSMPHGTFPRRWALRLSTNARDRNRAPRSLNSGLTCAVSEAHTFAVERTHFARRSPGVRLHQNRRMRCFSYVQTVSAATRISLQNLPKRESALSSAPFVLRVRSQY